MLIATGERILMMDADLATDLNDFPSCERQLLKIAKNDLGLITGSRRHLSQEVQAKRKFHRKIISLASSFIVNVICGINLRVIRKQMKGHLMWLQSVHQEHILNTISGSSLGEVGFRCWVVHDCEAFQGTRFSYLKAPFAEVPVNWHDVEGSHLNVVTASITMARDFLLVRILYLVGLWKFNDDIGLWRELNN
jgi:dolichyl-phosphate beta-glucosyltransferase